MIAKHEFQNEKGISFFQGVLFCIPKFLIVEVKPKLARPNRQAQTCTERLFKLINNG